VTADVTEYRHSGHAVWDIKYHLGWITKYRDKVLVGEVGERARDLLKQICAAREVRIVRGAVSPDHIHMLVVTPPQWAPAKLVGFLKGRSSRMAATRLPAPAQAVLGPTSVGTRVLLCDGGRGRREDGDGVHRESEMGPGRRRIQSHRAHRALSRLLSRSRFRRLQPQADFQSELVSTGFSR
jgi:REP element-mobilizing transposase RayT